MSDEVELETYARILAELSVTGADLADVLARHGLDEERWAALSSRAEGVIDAADEDSGIDELERFARAFAEAQKALSGAPAPFERWLEVITALQRGEQLAPTLERAGLTLERYLATQAHWAGELAKDPELLQRFHAAMLPKR